MDEQMCEAMQGMLAGMGGMPMMGGGMWLWMLVWGLVLIALIAAVAFVAVRLGSGGRDRGDGALRELEMRYARGELDREEYLQRREDLERR